MALCALLAGCSPRRRADVSPQGPFRHATLLDVRAGRGYRLVSIRDPWQNGRTLHRYVLVPRDSALPARLPEGTLLRTPLKRLVVFTSVHASLINELGRLGSMAGLADTKYVLEPRLLACLANGTLRDMGDALNPDVERILAARPDGLVVSPFYGSGGYGRLSEAGLPLIEMADYMERSPLGRAEWVRFVGMLTGAEARADSLFAAVERQYDALRRRAQAARRHPTVMADHMEGAAWYVPGGESTMGRLIADAGGRYLFSDNKQAGSVRLTFESVYRRARKADVWLLKYGRAADYTYASLRAERALYAAFRPWRERRIYGCNTLRVPFYDLEPFHPERLLADWVKILHPELGVAAPYSFYTPLK